MTSKEALNILKEEHYKLNYPLGGFSYLSEDIEQIEKDLDELEKFRRVYKLMRENVVTLAGTECYFITKAGVDLTLKEEDKINDK